jgi:RNA polymerase sigma factor (sigma-70 family)
MDWQSPDFCERFRRGDARVLEEIYWAYVDVVEHLLAGGFLIKDRQVAVPGVGNPDQRDDLLQEVFVNAFGETARRTFDTGRDFRAYVLSIGRHVLVDQHRRAGRPHVPYDADLDEVYSGPAPNSEQEWMSPELIQVAERYVASLTSPLRELHHARYALGRSQREAADDLGLSRQNVRTMEDRLKAGLRWALQQAWRTESAVRIALEGTDIATKSASGRVR